MWHPILAIDWPATGLDLAVRATMLLAAGGCMLGLWGRSSAAQRHLVWSMCLAGLLVLPALEALLPQWTLAIWPATDSPPAVSPPQMPASTEQSPSESLPHADAFALPTTVSTGPAVRELPVGKPSANSEMSEVHARVFDGLPLPSVGGALILAWGTGALVALLGLAAGVLQASRLTRQLPGIHDASWLALVRELASELGIRRRVTLVQSNAHAMPMAWGIWRSTIALPATADAWPPARRRAVLLHELAHIRRRDCLVQLVGQAACALYWFHPLAWFALRRMASERERACDDLVLSAGLRASDYSAELLAMARSLRPLRLAAAVAMARPSQLEGRLRALLEPRRCRQAVGRSGPLLGAFMLGTVAVLAMARPAAQGIEARKAAEPSPAAQADSATMAAEHTVRVQLRDRGGKPIADAEVSWLGTRRPELPWTNTPKNALSITTPQLLAQGRTDGTGQVTLRARFDAGSTCATSNINEPPGSMIIAQGKRLGLVARRHALANPQEEITLAPEIPIEGRLLTPSGAPAAGVLVTLDFVHRGDEWSFWANQGSLVDAPVPPAWPLPVRTDADGRFRLGGLSEGCQAIVIVKPEAFAWEMLTISTLPEPTEMNKAFEIVPLKPTFTHVLTAARPVQGTVTDKQTGKPMANIPIHVTAMRNHGGTLVLTQTDANGRYRVSAYQPQDFGYYVEVYPPADSGYIGMSLNGEKWPLGAKVLREDFALARGRLVHGRVVDSQTQQPIRNTAVVYKPLRGNAHSRAEYDFRNSVLTDAAGCFTITALPGPGLLIFEGPTSDYVRVTLAKKEIGQTTDVFPHGFTKIDVPESGDSPPVLASLRKGVTLEVRAVQPDGKPVPWVDAICREANARLVTPFMRGRRYEGGLFRITGAQPGRTYRLLFFQEDLNLMAAANVTCYPKVTGPVEVRLQPQSAVHGRLVYPNGSPALEARVHPMILVTADEGPMDRFSFFSLDRVNFYGNLVSEECKRYRSAQNIQPNSRGEFRIDSLMPGVKNYVCGGAAGKEIRYPVAPLRPGEDRDLGTLTLQEKAQ